MDKHIEFYETFSKKVIKLELPKKINWYMCGPTIYSDSHIGHARTLVGFDVMRKRLEKFALNITETIGSMEPRQKGGAKINYKHFCKKNQAAPGFWDRGDRNKQRGSFPQQ